MFLFGVKYLKTEGNFRDFSFSGDDIKGITDG